MDGNKEKGTNIMERKDHINFNLVVFCFWFSIYIYIPLFSVYLEKINYSYLMIGIILGGYGLTQILFRLPLGILSTVLISIRKKLLTWSFICAAISCLLLIVSEEYLVVFIARLIAGVTASMWVMATVLYSTYFRECESAKAMGMIQFNTVTTQFLCMTISGMLIARFGWKIPFWLGLFVAIIGAYLSTKIKEVESEQTSYPINFIHTFIRTHKIKGLKLMTYLSLIAHALLFITVFGFSPIIATSTGIVESQFVWMMGAFFIPHALASLSLTVFNIVNKWHHFILGLSFIGSAIFLALIPFGKSLLTLSIIHGGLGLALGFSFPLLLSEVIRISPKELQMSAMGYYQSFYAIGILLAPIIAGVIAEYVGLNEVFYFFSIITVVSVFILLYSMKKMKMNN